ncbi:MAG: aldo/keto reductase [Clostridia bacterium]|nr:aldo/keto reductase [Clostridia bacterium]
MQYVPFGKHGFDVSRLGFGCMRLPTKQEGEQRVVDQEAAIALIRRGIDGGITYVDTAYPYHGGESEIVVGKALKDGYREKVTLTTKLPIWAVNEEKDMNRLLDEQLKKLDVPYVDFYLLHAMGNDRLDKMQAFHYKDFLKEALGDGRIKRAGFSFHDGKEAFLRLLRDYDNWGMAQIQFNYLDDQEQATEDGLREAGRMGIPIVVMEPLRGGALATPPKNVRELMENNPHKRSAVEWAFAFIADYPEVATILSGMSSQEQLDDNLRIFDTLTVGGMTDDDRRFAKELKQAYLSRMPVKCTACQYCQPCPQNVHIPDIFQAYNSGKMFDNMGHFQWRYKELAEKGFDASQCVQCGACEAACPQHLTIIDWLQKIGREYGETAK